MLLLLISYQGVLSEPYHGYAVFHVTRPAKTTLHGATDLSSNSLLERTAQVELMVRLQE
jgi:hypothetical protein